MIALKKKIARIAHIKNILQERGLIRIKELAEVLDVSEMTVRRDIQQMELDGGVKNLNGMLISSSDASFETLSKKYDLHIQTMAHFREKDALGMAAASRINAGDSVVFDVGSTTERIAEHAPSDVKFEAICLSLNTFRHLADNPLAAKAIVGGYYQPDTEMFTGDEGLRFVRSIRPNKAFISAAGIHESLGVSCINPYEVAAKKAVLQAARHRILVADSSKFGEICSSHICDLDEIDEIITDDQLPAKWVSFIESCNIQLQLVSIK
jgi:DeoR family deoxyribose operon repressor